MPLKNRTVSASNTGSNFTQINYFALLFPIEYLKQMNDTTGAQLMAKSSGQNSECSSRRESAVQVWVKLSK